jgi:hypothetical protein
MPEPVAKLDHAPTARPPARPREDDPEIQIRGLNRL